MFMKSLSRKSRWGKYYNILTTTVKVVFLSVIAFVLVQCKNETDTTRAIPVIDIEKGLNKGGTVKLSELCSSLEYIPLYGRG